MNDKTADQKAMMKKVAWQSTIHKALEQEHEKSLAEFAKDTSFHGVKYIFDGETSSPFRRILWLLCWMTAIGLFAYQVATRVLEYRKHPTNVDVKIMYTDSVTFPTVTICNQNQFRFRRAVDLKMYDLLDNIYKTTNPKGINMSAYEYPKDSTVEEIFKELAHEKLDFIAKCTWDYRECDRDADFTMTTTDMGYCFTFNAANSTANTKNVTDPGIGAGLRLIFNVEQYEYMRGPHSDAGIKVYLHDWKEFPLVTDKGFSAGPGSHTVATVESIQVSNLNYPYGNCIKGAEPMNNCRLKCVSQKAMKVCGCRDMFMLETLGNETIPICDMTSKLKCLTTLTSNIQKNDYCSCSQPCERQKYEASLSNAQLSRFNVKTTVIRDDQHLQKVNNDFLESMERSQREISDNVKANENVMGRARYVYKDIAINAYGLVKQTTETHIMAQMEKTLDLKNSDQMQLLEKSIEAFGDSVGVIEEAVKKLDPTKDELEDSEDVIEIFEKMEWKNGRPVKGFRDAVQRCVNIEAALPRPSSSGQSGSSGPSSAPSPISAPVPAPVPAPAPAAAPAPPPAGISAPAGISGPGQTSFTFTSQDPDCKELNEKIKEIFEKCTEVQEDFGPEKQVMFLQWKIKMDNFTTELFQGTSKTPSALNQQCLTGLDAVHEKFIKVISVQANASTAQQSGADQAQIILDLADSLLQMNITDGSWLKKYGNYDSCEWLENEFKASPEFTKIRSSADFKTKMTSLMASFDSVVDVFQNMWDKFNETMIPVFVHLDHYFDEKATKLSLVDPFDSMEFKEATTSLFSTADTILKYAIDLESDKWYVDQFIDKFVESLVEAPVPVLKPAEYLNLSVIQAVQDLQSKRLETHLLALQNSENSEKNFGEVLKVLIEAFLQPVDGGGRLVGVKSKEASSTFEALVSFLQEYKKAVLMDQEFYMQNFLMLDIYFSELSFEKINQQEAFVFLSLISEIGGFLGLLLGASILTVCEVLDYTLMYCIRCNKKRKAVDQDPLQPFNK